MSAYKNLQKHNINSSRYFFEFPDGRVFLIFNLTPVYLQKSKLFTLSKRPVKMSLLRTIAIFFSLLTSYQIHTVDFQSRCSHLFSYEGRGNEPDRWYGVILLAPHTNSSSVVSFRLIFDRPAEELVLNLSMAYFSTRDNQEFLVEVPASSVKNISRIVRFHVKYNPNEPAPNLIVFRMDEKTVCPDVTVRKQLRTSPFRTNDTANIVNEDKSSLYPSLSSNNRPSDDLCGTVVVKPTHVDPDGTSYEGEFPWYAALVKREGGVSSITCGASLISRYHVLTVAHCVTMNESRIPIKRKSLKVFVGVHYPNRFHTYNVQTREVFKIMIHPQYRPSNSSYNIAVVEFIAPVDITDYVRPVCLWEDSLDLKSIVDKQGKVVGWTTYGRTKSRTTRPPSYHNVPIVSQENCAMVFSKDPDRNTYCAGKLHDALICRVLSFGNGMVLPKSDTNQQNPRWQLRGMVYATALDDLECDPSFYVVFIDVAAHLDWIRKSLQ